MKHDYTDNRYYIDDTNCCIWTPANQLRWFVVKNNKQLQQLWLNENDEQRWLEVPIVYEGKDNE